MKLTRRLGLGALALGIAAPMASPYRSTRGELDVDAIARAILAGEDHVEAPTLARWIRERKPGLRVIDVRDAAAFGDDAIPTAENIPLDRLTRATFAPAQAIVLYSEEGAHGGQAWVMLRALGIVNARFIAGGLADWRDDVMYPVLRADASADEREAFAAIAELSRYFGGQPRVGEPGESAANVEARRRETLRRRGC
ncbi:MAG: rhodanese-like domain-containing protein [Pseudomonadota bacterium]